jgi:MFS transporter, FHS family, glucose/mannose:H+ symporter
MNGTASANPSLRHRLPLYPNYFLNAMPMASLGPLLDHMMRDLRVPLERGGLVSGGLFAGAALGLIIFNLALARASAKSALSGGTALMGLGLIVGGAATHSLWALFLVYLVVGLGGSVSATASWMWLSAHIKEHMAASALVMILYFGLGMIAVPVLVGRAIDLGATWRWVLAVEGGISLLSAAIFAFMPLLDIPERQNVRFSHLKTVATHEPWLLLGIVGASFMYTGAESVINIWLPKFQIDTFSSNDTSASLSVTLFWVGLVVGRLAFIPLTKRYPAARLLLICMTIMAAFSAALAFAPSQAVALVMAVGAGLGASASYGLISSYGQHYPEWQSGVAVSLFILSGSVGSVTLPYLLGPLARAAGFRAALALVAIPAIACALFGQLIHKRAETRL